MAERKTKVELDVEMSGFLAKMRLAKTAVSDMHSKWLELKKKGKTRELEDGLMSITAAIGVVAVAAVTTAAQYEAAVSRMQAATRASAEQMGQLKDATLAAGRSGVFSATEAAQAVTELGKASLSAEQIIGGGLQGALDLAAAGEMQVGDAAETAASAMSMFQLSAESVPHIADLLAAGAGKAQGEVSDMAMALNQAGLVAAQTGLSIEETTGALAAMANAGLIGSDAGTSLKTMLMRLSGPTAAAKNLMDDLGISAFDAQGNFVGLTQFAGSLQSALAGMSEEQRQATLTTIFGSDAVRAAAIIYQQGADGIGSWIAKVNDAGYAAEQAAIKNDNLIGDLKKLRGAIEGAFISQGGGLTGVLRLITQLLTGLVNGFASLPGPIQSTITWLVLLTGVGTGLAVGYVKVTASLAATKVALLAMGTAGQIAAKAMTAVGVAIKFMFKAAIVVGVLWGIFEAVKAIVGSESGPEALTFQVEELTQSLKDLGNTGTATGKFATAYGKNLQAFGKTLIEYQQIIDDFNTGESDRTIATKGGGLEIDRAEDAAEATEKLKASTVDLDAALAQMVQGGYAGAAANSFSTMRDSMLAAGFSLDQIGALFPAYTAAVVAAQQANTGLGDGFGTVASNSQLMEMSWIEAVNTGRSLTDIFNELNGAAMAWAGAEIEVEQAADDLTKALDASNGSLNVHAQLGRDAKSALLDYMDAAVAAMEAKYAETGSVGEAKEVYAGYIDQLRAMAKKYPELADDIQEIIDLYAKMPKNITVYLSEIKNTYEYFHKTHGRADGAVVDYESYASGGMRGENHIAQIAPAGSWRVWAEDETGGEAYIPLAPGKRNRSEQIWAEVGRRFGKFQAHSAGAAPTVKPIIVQNMPVTAWNERFSLAQVQSELAMYAAV